MNNTGINPLGQGVLIQPQEAQEKTDSGIFIPEKAREKQRRGTVLAVGAEVKELVAGAKVIYGQLGGTEMKAKGKTYLLINEDQVLAEYEG